MSAPAHRAKVLTPPGTGAIALIRVTGPDPLSQLHSLLPLSRKLRGNLLPGRLVYSRLMDGNDVLDDVILSMEPTVETHFAIDIFCHGGIRIVQRILEALKNADVILAADSETGFLPAATTLEVEALKAMIQSRTRRAALYAAKLRIELPELVTRIAQDWTSNRERAQRLLDQLVRGAPAARALLDGVRLALVGPPNSGKSTLFNTLIGRSAAVTSPIPGTTRDWISEGVEFSGLSVEIVDTAGRHEAQDVLDAQAIEAGVARAQNCQGAVIVLDGSTPTPAIALVKFAIQTSRIWVAMNKSDLGCRSDSAIVDAINKRFGSPPIALSARTGEGCELLKKTVLEYFGLADPDAPPVSLFTDRQLAIADQIQRNPNRGELLLWVMVDGPAGVATP